MELNDKDLAKLITQPEVPLPVEPPEPKKPLREVIDNAIAGEGLIPKVVGGAASIPVALLNMKPKVPTIYNV